MVRLSVLSLVALFVVQLPVRATDDFNPAAGPTGGWEAVTTTTFYWALDADNKVKKITLKGLEVDSALIGSHAQTKAATKLKHSHVQRDFDGVERNQVDAYWNWFFRSPTLCAQ